MDLLEWVARKRRKPNPPSRKRARSGDDDFDEVYGPPRSRHRSNSDDPRLVPSEFNQIVPYTGPGTDIVPYTGPGTNIVPYDGNRFALTPYDGDPDYWLHQLNLTQQVPTGNPEWDLEQYGVQMAEQMGNDAYNWLKQTIRNAMDPRQSALRRQRRIERNEQRLQRLNKNQKFRRALTEGRLKRLRDRQAVYDVDNPALLTDDGAPHPLMLMDRPPDEMLQSVDYPMRKELGLELHADPTEDPTSDLPIAVTRAQIDGEIDYDSDDDQVWGNEAVDCDDDESTGYEAMNQTGDHGLDGDYSDDDVYSMIDDTTLIETIADVSTGDMPAKARTGGKKTPDERAKAFKESGLIEYKAIDTALTATDVHKTNAYIQLLNGCAQGSDFHQRIGRLIKIKHVKVLLEVYPTDTTIQPQTVTVSLVVDKQTNGAAPAITDIYQTGNSMAFDNLDNRERFRILGHRTILIGSADVAAGGGAPLTPSIGRVDMVRKMNTSVVFGGVNATVADIKSNSLFVVIRSSADSGPGVGCNVSGVARVRFTDN